MSTFLLSNCASVSFQDHSPSPQHADGRFRNGDAARKPAGLGKSLALAWRFMTEKPADASPAAPLAIQTLTQAELLAAPERSLWRLGHSTVLIKLDGGFWLTDPVWAERASPLQWLGPKRFHAPPIAIEDLPPLRAVILSHDHYDHLDDAAVRALAGKTERFVTPLGVGDRLIAWGIPAAKVQQLDWWQELQIGSTRLVCTPAQHFSGRGLNDTNKTLWASWALLGADAKLFFSGDTGYFAGFKTIGERLGPFDLSLMETGAYDAEWPDVHMQPEQSLQAHLDLRARTLLPIHNGTFDLALHGWTEPFERISALAAAQAVPLSAPRIGERVDILAPAAMATAWWR